MPTITCSWAWLCASCFWKPSQGRHGACQVQSKQQRDQRGHLLLLGTALWFLPVCPSSSRSAPYRMKTSLYNSQCKTWFQTTDKVRSSKTSASVCLLHKGLVTRKRGITPKLESPPPKTLKWLRCLLMSSIQWETTGHLQDLNLWFHAPNSENFISRQKLH